MPALRRAMTLLLLLPLAGCPSKPDGDTKKTNETNDGIAFDGSTLSITDASGTLTADLSSLENDADADPANELQTLDFDAMTGSLSLSNGNMVSIPDVDTDDQTIVFDNGTRMLAILGGNTALIPDADTDAQTLALSALGELSVSGGNSLILPGLVRTKIVSPVPGDPLAGGASLMAAVATLNPAPSATNPWVIRMEPGLYDLGSGTVDIPGFVSLQGAGRSATRIIGAGDPQVLSMTDASEVRDLAVVITSNAVNASVGIFTGGTGGARIEHVEVSATGFGATVTIGMTLTATTTVVDSRIAFAGAGAEQTTGLSTSLGTSSVLRRVEVSLLRPEVLNLYGLHLEGTTRVEGGSVTTQGLAAYGIEVYATNTALIGVDVSATGTAVPAQGLHISTIVAPGPVDVEVRNAAITGSSTLSGQSNLRVSFSRFDGLSFIDPAATAICANTIDANYAPFPLDCVP